MVERASIVALYPFSLVGVVVYEQSATFRSMMLGELVEAHVDSAVCAVSFESEVRR